MLKRYLTGYSFWSDGRVAWAVRFRKTTLLRIIAGLEHQTSGHIRFHGTDVSRLHARDRKVGFVFQHYALFRHMTVFDNIAFGLTVLPRRERPNAAAIKAKVT